jgi:hypothetical protein
MLLLKETLELETAITLFEYIEQAQRQTILLAEAMMGNHWV